MDDTFEGFNPQETYRPLNNVDAFRDAVGGMDTDRRHTVNGVLLLTDAEFRVLGETRMEPDPTMWVEIDDPLAADKFRECVGRPLRGGLWYRGPAIITARVREVAGRRVLYDVGQIDIYEWENQPPACVRVRT